MSRELSSAELGQRRAAAVRHGGSSELQVKRVATLQKRRLLRQIGLRMSDLEGIGLAYLDNWARAQAKVELMDAYAGRAWLTGGGRDAAGICCRLHSPP